MLTLHEINLARKGGYQYIYIICRVIKIIDNVHEISINRLPFNDGRLHENHQTIELQRTQMRELAKGGGAMRQEGTK